MLGYSGLIIIIIVIITMCFAVLGQALKLCIRAFVI